MSDEDYNSIEKQVLVTCWSCSVPVLLKRIQYEDGYCPNCGAPIDLDEDEE